MTDVTPEPIRAPKTPGRTKNSWQNQPSNRKPVNPTRVSQAKGDPAKFRAIYADDNHPKDKDGNNICGAKIKRGGICVKPAGQRTAHEGWGKCSFHGGNTPTLSTSAARFADVAVQDKMTIQYGYGGPIELLPGDALLQEVGRTGGHVAFLAERISMWEMDTEKGISAARQDWIKLYHQERAHLVKVAKMALDAGIDERKVRIAENQGMQILGALNKIFDMLELNPDQRKLIPVVVPQILRSLSEPQPKMVLGVVDRALGSKDRK